MYKLLLALSCTFFMKDYTAGIKDHDLSKLWRGDSIRLEGGREFIAFQEPLGFLGDNYQHFYIHYNSVTKSKDDPYKYIVKGKTKLKDNICSFTGTILVQKAKIEESQDAPGYIQGIVTCDVLFYEDSTHAGSGVIKGELTTNFSIDKKGKLEYDALIYFSDGYCNNQCRATWTSYKTGKSKKCNWGDFRIPDSGDLDLGVGDFIVNEKYSKNGWEDFDRSTGGFKEIKWWK